MKKNVRLGIGLIIVIALVVGGYLGLKGNSLPQIMKTVQVLKPLRLGPPVKPTPIPTMIKIKS